MKKPSTTLFSDINKEQLANLTTVVKETISMGIQTARRNFSAAELWDIQRRKRVFPTRRLSF